MLTSLIAIILVIIGFVYKFFTFKQSRKRRKTLLLKIVKLKSVEKENKHYKETTIYYDPNTQSETEYVFYNSSGILPKEFKIENIKPAFVIKNKLFLDNTIDTVKKIIFK